MQLRRRDGGALVILILLLLALLALMEGATQLGRDRASFAPVRPLTFEPPINLPGSREPEVEAPPANVRPAPVPFARPRAVVAKGAEPDPPPANLTAVPGPAGEVVLSWTAGERTADGVGYEVRRDTELVHEGPETTFVDDEVRAPTRYCWEVRALGAALRASAPASVCATPRDVTPPTVPLNLAARLPRDDHVEVTWAESRDDVGAVSYQLFDHGTRIARLTRPSWSASGLTPGTEHCYSVRAEDASGNQSEPSPNVCVTTRTAEQPPPTKVTIGGSDFSASVTREKVTLVWRKTDADVVYRIYTAGGKVVGATAGNSFVHTRISGESQCYRIRALDRDGRESPPSTPICVPASFGTSASLESGTP